MPTPPSKRAAGGIGRRIRSSPLLRATRRVSAMGRGPSAEELRGNYLDLLEKALLHSLYWPPDAGEMPKFAAEAFGESMKQQAAGKPVAPIDPAALRGHGRDWPVYAQTMIGVKRLRSLRRCVQQVIADRVPGDLIEAGCWRGGASILMQGILTAHGEVDRSVYAADSFAGVPEPNPDKYPADAGDLNYTADELAIPLEQVKDNFRRYGLLGHNVHFLEGWFKDTLPTVGDRSWAVVRLDGDLYESTMDGLTNLYPGLSDGGYLIIDDYGWENCRQAVEDFRDSQGISEPIERIDWVGAYWRKGG